MRLFIGIELDSSAKDYLSALQKQLKPFIVKGRLSREDLFHLTLSFIGNVPDSDLPDYYHVLERAAGQAGSFSCVMNSIGQFTRKHRAVLWAGIENNPPLMALQRNIETILKDSLGYIGESRDYHPHITLGRNIEFSEPFDNIRRHIQIEPFSFVVKKVTLFESTSKDGQLIYVPIFQAELNT